MMDGRKGVEPRFSRHENPGSSPVWRENPGSTPVWRLAVVLAAVLSVSATLADDALPDCAKIDDATRRLECYDRHASGDGGELSAPAEPAAAAEPSGEPAPEVAQPASAVPQPKATAPTPAPPAEDRFGLPEEGEEDEEEPDEINARIVSIDVRSNGERIFTLDNGQVWDEDSPTPSLRLKAGDTVTIKSGLFGSHRLYGSGKRSSLVDRLR